MSTEAKPTHATVPVALLRDLYVTAEEKPQTALEEGLPMIFGRPTFVIGETIKLLPSLVDVMIIGKTDLPTESLVALSNAKTGELLTDYISVKSSDQITEREFLKAGESLGLTRKNYAKFYEHI